MGSDRHKASKSERLLPPLYFVAAACIASRMSYQMLGIIGNSKEKTVCARAAKSKGGQLCRGCTSYSAAPNRAKATAREEKSLRTHM